MNRKTTVNADDFGASSSITDSIIEFLKMNYCDTTTVMINMDDYKKTFLIAQKAGVVDRVGLHLNITKGNPITQKIKESKAFCVDGKFGIYKTKKINRFVLNKHDRIVLEQELRAQIERYIHIGYKGMTIDSHQGVHMDWPVYPIVIQLAEEYGFKKIRRSPNLTDSLSRKIIRLPYDIALKHSRIKTSKYMGSIYDYKRKIKDLDENCTVEIMTHPQIKNDVVYVDVNTNYLLNEYKSVLENRI